MLLISVTIAYVVYVSYIYTYICGNESVASLVASLNGRCLRIAQKQKNAVKEIPSDSGYEVSGTRRKFRWKR